MQGGEEHGMSLEDRRAAQREKLRRALERLARAEKMRGEAESHAASPNEEAERRKCRTG